MSAVHGLAEGTTALRALADEAGILPRYQDQTGVWRETSDETRRALLEAMGLEAGTEHAAALTLEALRAERTERPIEPVRVLQEGDPANRLVTVAMPAPQREPLRWQLSLVTEEGEEYALEGEAPQGVGHTFAVELPAALPYGYHTLRVALETAHGPIAAEQLLIVVPPSCLRAEDLLQGRRVWGLVVNLYSLRSARNWGIGDVTDLGNLVEWAGALGAQFVGLNPLHAIHNRGTDVSPYSPISRIFRNPAYVDIEAIPELEFAPGLRRHLESAEHRRELHSLRDSSGIDYERVMRAKWPVLRACYDAAAARETSERWSAFRTWAHQHEPELSTFAAYMAREVGGFASEATPAYEDAAASNVDFHRWVQWELERQLAAVFRRATDAGMQIGLYQDLAIGSAANGSDAESFPGVFVRGVAVGAPPDPYSAHGQNWGFPPLDPHRLREGRYRYFIELVRAGFRSAGALRIDHVMGLFRLFWIPEGKQGEDGAYVRFPAEDLLGILALESRRHRALVVGEDLGTVPADVPPALHRWGILSSKVLYFERSGDGSFRSPREYPAEALATANTHDMATLIGFVRGRDVELRIEHGLVAPGGEAQARAERDRDRAQLLERLVRERLLDPAQVDDMTAFRAAVHDHLAESPAWLVGVSLDDIAGESEAVNLPGVSPDRYPAWQRRMTMPLEQLFGDPDVVAALGTRLAQGR